GQTAARAGPGQRRDPERQASPSAPEARVRRDKGAVSRHGRQRRPARWCKRAQGSSHLAKFNLFAKFSYRARTSGNRNRP
ncbi:MAG: hypothetical protein ACK55Z_07340, partial [bacterium]